MERARGRTRQLPDLRRGFERSRLEDQLVAAAYEWAFPIRRKALRTTRPAQEDEVPKDQPTTIQGGLSA
jgi:hypothetical protein